MLLQPQLESRLARGCEQWASGGDPDLARRLRTACTALAAPASRCLIEESERSEQSLAVLNELLHSRFGASSERVVQRCAARLLGLPADSLRELPLRELAGRFQPGAAQRP